MASAARNVAARSIHVKIYPTARSLPERREVLRVLERFGEVEMFRSLKYDSVNPVPNAFLSILSTEEAAQAALEASPIRYRLIADSASAPPPPSSPLASIPSENNPQLDASSSSSSSSPSPLPTAQPLQESIFELRLSPSTHSHRASITSSPLHSTYTPVSLQRSPIALDLSQRIPPSIAKAGLVDWVTDSARAGTGGRGIRMENREEGGEEGDSRKASRKTVQWGRGSGGTGWEEMRKPWRVRDRERAAREERVPWVMKGLKSRMKGETGATNGSEP